MDELESDLTVGNVGATLGSWRLRRGLSARDVAWKLGISLAAFTRIEAGAIDPTPAQRAAIKALIDGRAGERIIFSSHAPGSIDTPSLFDVSSDNVEAKSSLSINPLDSILDRITKHRTYLSTNSASISDLLACHQTSAPTVSQPPSGAVSAGKNTYTYDAHTYHTKVPPQGIAELLRYYLPEGGLILDLFAGSGMTGVAANALGYDSILNELSPAACFIASRFVSKIDPKVFKEATTSVLEDLQGLREKLYTTYCRDCRKTTELLYTVWSYRVTCPECTHEFNLWDVCRRYGKTVREHKILSEFDCPNCSATLKKRTLQRTIAEPVEVAYKCCGSRQREATAAPDESDVNLILSLEASAAPVAGYYPTLRLPDGVNLAQPRKHGLDTIDKFYTHRALIGLSHIWRNIHRIEDAQVAGQVAFVFTSLYRRVTRLSEFRFWGGSGNTARLNVPFIFEESNIFLSFERKARTIEDHLRTTAQHFTGRTAVIEQSATSLDYLPDNSVDLVFTDPPFGANINYSEMNFLWESWLGRFTNSSTEAIVNRVQGKTLEDYEKLMCASLSEAYRVLRPEHWMLLVFMNSSASVWEALRSAVEAAGFIVVTADVFDKQHGTFKHFVSENTAGSDIVLHCLKPSSSRERLTKDRDLDLQEFLELVDFDKYLQPYLHVDRATEYDLRRIYSEWIAHTLTHGGPLLDFAQFRDSVDKIRESRN